MAEDEFFGYDIAALRMPPEISLKETLEEYNEHNYYSDQASVSYDRVPDPENNPDDIEYINAQILGEQPATAEYRAQQWKRLAELLASVEKQLRDQTVELANAWESPKAKEIFLSKVGETLAQLDVWHEFATTNSSALLVLAQIQREVQDEMNALYDEYKNAIKHSATEMELANLQGMAGATNNAARDTYEPGPPSSQGGDRLRAQWRETMRSADENKENYDKWARELAYRLAQRYDPVIEKLKSARLQKMVPLNAVNHPGAFGLPIDLKPPGGPGGPPGGPGDAPNAPPTPPPLEKPPFDKDKLPFDKDKPPLDKDKLPDALDKSQLPNPGDAPTLPPPVPPLPPVAPVASVAPNAPNPLGAPNLSPNARNALNNALNRLGLPANGAPNLQVGTQSLNMSATAQFSTTASSALSGSLPPGTITPPPGGIPNQPKQQGKVLGQRPGVSPPPGAQGRTPGAAGQRNPGGATDIPEAFRPPPLSSAPVLENKKRKRRPGGAKEAPTAQTGTPNATPPVLSNPHRGSGPARTYSEQRAQRRKESQPTPEIATGTPTGTAPVLTGRFAPAPETSETPITLPGRAQAPAVRDPHARPEIHADRTARAPRQAEPAAGEPSTWEVQTPGGPVVATGTTEKQYRAEPPGAVGGR